ncbi:MAG: PIG-L family deacetylase [Phycisphaerae bacterium]|nr:PIG-L family deacetylase [Phycisphaerae bacterium]
MPKVAIESVLADIKTAAVIVAHPDDETLWAGGTILLNPQIGWTILSLCRKSDPDRAPKFFRVIDQFGAKGSMTDLDDGPDQKPLKQTDIQKTILSALSEKSFDIILTHNPKGEYTRHLRHEETSLAVLSLWKQGELKAKRLLLFAYEDGLRRAQSSRGKKYLPRPQKDADIVVDLPKNIYQRKKDIIINSYGFSPDSFEAKAVSNVEAFRLIKTPKDTII